MHQSWLWAEGHVTELRLQENMRVQRVLQSAADEDERRRIEQFADTLMDVGNGANAQPGPDGSEVVQLQDVRCCEVHDQASVDAMLQWVYGDGHSDDWRFWAKRAVVSPRHASVDYVNDVMLSRLPGEVHTLLSADSLSADDAGRADAPINTDLLHKLTSGGLPHHELRLKVGAVIILLRNLDPSRGLSNGVRLRVECIRRNSYLRCKIISGRKKGDDVLIPRIKLAGDSTHLPYSWVRLQFPVKLAYCMTINKSQGQTLERVAVLLGAPVLDDNGQLDRMEDLQCFAHGQLYVALSRVGHPDAVRVYAVSDVAEAGRVKLEIYREALVANRPVQCRDAMHWDGTFAVGDDGESPALFDADNDEPPAYGRDSHPADAALDDYRPTDLLGTDEASASYWRERAAAVAESQWFHQNGVRLSDNEGSIDHDAGLNDLDCYAQSDNTIDFHDADARPRSPTYSEQQADLRTMLENGQFDYEQHLPEDWQELDWEGLWGQSMCDLDRIENSS